MRGSRGGTGQTEPRSGGGRWGARFRKEWLLKQMGSGLRALLCPLRPRVVASACCPSGWAVTGHLTVRTATSGARPAPGRTSERACRTAMGADAGPARVALRPGWGPGNTVVGPAGVSSCPSQQPRPCPPPPPWPGSVLPAPTWMSGCLPSVKLLLSLIETFMKFLRV